MTKRERILKTFRNEPVDRVPVGFWFHFIPEEFHNAAMDDLSLMVGNREGHKKYIEEFDPDLIKVMTDGIFTRPFKTFPKIECAKDLYDIKPLPHDHPYFAENLSLARDIRAMAGDDVVMLYNVFSPMFNLVKVMMDNDELTGIYALIQEDADAMRYALSVLAEDMKYLVDMVIREGGMDGIFFSVNNARQTLPPEVYRDVIRPYDLAVLDVANAAGGYPVLHICSNRTRLNDLSGYRDYPVTAFNWSVHDEGMSLAEGKEFFGGKCVLGGFSQYPGSLIHVGTKEEIQQAAKDLLADFPAPCAGVIVGADCTVPMDTPVEHLLWVREALK